MKYFMVQFFDSRNKAYALRRKLGTGDVYHYSEKSRSKIEYEIELKARELGYFVEEFAKQFPYCVSWCPLNEKTPIK